MLLFVTCSETICMRHIASGLADPFSDRSPHILLSHDAEKRGMNALMFMCKFDIRRVAFAVAMLPVLTEHVCLEVADV